MRNSRNPLRRAAVLAVAWAAGHAGHELGDYLVQRDCDAKAKQQRTPEGRRALAIHAVTYGLAQAAMRAAAYRVAGLRVPAAAQLAAAAAETALHAGIDDGRALATLARRTGKWQFHQLGGLRRVAAVVDDGNGGHQRVHMVRLHTNGDPIVQRDEKGRITDTATHDNPTPGTGRALMDQAAHKSIQIPLGSAITALLTD